MDELTNDVTGETMQLVVKEALSEAMSQAMDEDMNQAMDNAIEKIGEARPTRPELILDFFSCLKGRRLAPVLAQICSTKR